MKKGLLIFILFYFLLLGLVSVVSAGDTNPQATTDPETPNTSGTVQLNNPLTGSPTNTDIPTLLGKVINSIMSVIGSLALVMFIYGGIIWMLSAGNQEQVTKGKNILIWAAVGIVIIFSSYALVKLVLTATSL
ncbi:MAG: pilin [Candidatus Paceibacterota bacterium]|jgi:cbb3-type cytochrome oxidase subunit 3